MARDVGQRLKDHLHWLLRDQLGDEIAYQIDTPWASYFDQLVFQLIKARDAQQQVFEQAKQAQLDYERRHERAYAVFNFFKGIALSWLSAQLQYRVIGNYLKKEEWSGQAVGWQEATFEVEVSYHDTKDSKIAGKLIADLGKEVGGWLVSSLGFSKGINPVPVKLPDAHGIAFSRTPEDLRDALNKEMRSQRDYAISAMEVIDKAVMNDPEFGDRLAERVYKVFPSATDAFAETAGYIWLNTMVNALRMSWQETPGMEFFAYDPPKRADFHLANHMEKEMWILWYIEWHHQSYVDHSLDAAGLKAGRLEWYETIVEHMSDLNIPTNEVITTKYEARRLEAEERLIQWCRKHKPEDPTRDRQGTLRQLPSIDQWVRPSHRTW